MIGDTIQVTYNAVAKTLSKINQDNFGATYFLEESGIRYTASVKHTIPARGKAGESHLFRLDVEHYDANGALLRTAQAWSVIKTNDGVQDSTSSNRVANAMVSFMTAGNITKLVNRES